MPPPSCTGMSESTAAMICLMAASLRGLPTIAPFRSTTCRRRAPSWADCEAVLPGSFEKTVALSMRPCSRRTQAPSFRSIAGMMIMGCWGAILGIPGGEVAKEREPRVAALLGMELRRENIIPRDGRGKGIGIVRLSRGDRTLGRLAIEAVHEIEPARVLDALPQRVRGDLAHLVPAHVGNLHARPALEALHLAPNQREPGRVAFGAALEEHLLADAKAEEGLAPRRLSNRLSETGFAQRSHAIGHRALSRENHAIGRPDIAGVGRDLHFGLGRDMLQGLLHGAQVPHAVVDDGNSLRGARHVARDAKELEGALRRGDDAGSARIALDRHSQRARECLEYRLALVMRVVAAQVVDMHRRLCVVHETLEELVREVHVEIAHAGAPVVDVPLEPRAPGKIHDGARQGLVERDVSMAVAADSLLVAQRLGDRHAERDADLLAGVVRVDLQVAFRLHFQVERSVARDLVEHVVEERDAGGKARLAAPVEVEGDPHLGLPCIALDFGLAHRSIQPRAVASASSIRVFSSGVPTVSLRQWASRGCEPWNVRTNIPRSLRASNARGPSGTRTRMKWAADGKRRARGIASSAASRRARSATIAAVWPSKTTRCSSSRSAAAAESEFTLYGMRSFSSSSIHSRDAIATPTRRPASPSFDTVRTRTRLGCFPTSSRSEAPPENA